MNGVNPHIKREFGSVYSNARHFDKVLRLGEIPIASNEFLFYWCPVTFTRQTSGSQRPCSWQEIGLELHSNQFRGDVPPPIQRDDDRCGASDPVLWSGLPLQYCCRPLTVNSTQRLGSNPRRETESDLSKIQLQTACSICCCVSTAIRYFIGHGCGLPHVGSDWKKR